MKRKDLGDLKGPNLKPFVERSSSVAQRHAAPRLTEYIREKDVLEQWPMSKATLIRARKKGLAFVKLGAFICYRPEDLEAHFRKDLSQNPNIMR